MDIYICVQIDVEISDKQNEINIIMKYIIKHNSVDNVISNRFGV